VGHADVEHRDLRRVATAGARILIGTGGHHGGGQRHGEYRGDKALDTHGLLPVSRRVRRLTGVRHRGGTAMPSYLGGREGRRGEATVLVLRRAVARRPVSRPKPATPPRGSLSHGRSGWWG